MSIQKHTACPNPECQPSASSKIDAGGEGESRLDGSHNLSSPQDGQTSPSAVYNPFYTGRPRSPNTPFKHEPINRQEIIRRIKSRDHGSRPGSPELERPPSSSGWRRREAAPLPPVVDSTPARPRSREEEAENMAAGIQIERPRSALHRGDFREREQTDGGFGRFAQVSREEQAPALSTSPVVPWHPGFPAAAFRQAWLERRQSPPRPPTDTNQRTVRPRAVSNATLANSFTYKPPTSPLVHQSRPDTPDPPSRPLSPSTPICATKFNGFEGVVDIRPRKMDSSYEPTMCACCIGDSEIEGLLAAAYGDCGRLLKECSDLRGWWA